MYKLMTPGPTSVSKNVLEARAKSFRNPDVDEKFVEEYKKLCLKISELLGTKNETFILGGEGILGLEVACASLIERGDKVLVIENGIFGKGFADFVEMYGGEVTLYSDDYKSDIDVEKLKTYLKANHDFKIATVVHGDTPSGVLNNVDEITKALKQYDILTIVDSVSTLFGDKVSLDNIDILCGGSQKVISAPPGLTLNIVSDKAKEVINNRKTSIASFYANLKVFFNYYEEKWFPYTMPISDINGLAVAIENIANENSSNENSSNENHELSNKMDTYARHQMIASATRNALTAAGLKLYLNKGYANTVTAFEVPSGITAKAIIDTVRDDFDIQITGSFGVFAGKLIRIGHMGNNANKADMEALMDALDKTFEKLGVKLAKSLKENFNKEF